MQSKIFSADVTPFPPATITTIQYMSTLCVFVRDNNDADSMCNSSIVQLVYNKKSFFNTLMIVSNPPLSSKLTQHPSPSLPSSVFLSWQRSPKRTEASFLFLFDLVLLLLPIDALSFFMILLVMLSQTCYISHVAPA
jgi:hypothetical protein